MGRLIARAILLVTLLSALCAAVAGQLVVINGAVNQTEQNNNAPFSIRKQSTAVTEALEDFERYRDKKAWDKAFAALTKVIDSQSSGLAAGTDGFYIPTAAKICAELISLPPDGREAYRLFNDAVARQKLADIIAGSDDATDLARLVDRYFVTSVGDQAADRLGDALFEAGDFTGAGRAWRMVLDSYPDTTLSPALLQTKCAIALARDGQWDQFQAVRALVHDRYAGQTITLGGQEVAADKYLDDLAAQAPAPAAAAPARAALGLPSNDTPAWQIPLLDSDAGAQIQANLNQFGWGFMAQQFTTGVPPSAVDDKRVYINWFGVGFAADLNTGKMLWRTDTFTDFAQNAQQIVMRGQGLDFSGNAILSAGDHVLLVQATGNRNNQGVITRLLCLAADTGKTIWNSDQRVLAGWSFIGRPVVVGDAVYICAHPQSTMDISLLRIGLTKGDLRWNVPLGAAQAVTNPYGGQVGQPPTLLCHLGKVYVLTNSGVLLAVDISQRQVQWAFSCSTQTEIDPAARANYGYNVPVEVQPPGAMLARGSTLYVKETAGDMMFAIDVSGPALRWKRPIDPTVTLAGLDDRNLYFAGIEADCINADSRAMQWSDRLSVGVSDIRPLLIGGHMYIFGQRGVHDVSLSNGEASSIFRGDDRDSLGGAVWYTAGKLITVSGTAVTAYPLK